MWYILKQLFTSVSVGERSLPFGRGSRVTSLGSRVTSLGSSLTSRGSRVTSRGSTVTSRGSTVTGRGSKNSSQLFSNIVKSKFRVYSSFWFLFYFTSTPGGIICF